MLVLSFWPFQALAGISVGMQEAHESGLRRNGGWLVGEAGGEGREASRTEQERRMDA